jgi:hypothetical protein
MIDQVITLKYSKWRAAYSIIVPASLLVGAVVLIAMYFDIISQRLLNRPLAVPMFIVGFAIWIGGTWPNAFRVLIGSLDQIEFAGGRATLVSHGRQTDLGRITSVRKPKFTYGRLRITTDKLSGSYDVITAFVENSQDISPEKLARALESEVGPTR